MSIQYTLVVEQKDLCGVVSVERVERRPLAGTTGIFLLLDDFDVGLSRYKCIRNQLKWIRLTISHMLASICIAKGESFQRLRTQAANHDPMMVLGSMLFRAHCCNWTRSFVGVACCVSWIQYCDCWYWWHRCSDCSQIWVPSSDCVDFLCRW